MSDLDIGMQKRMRKEERKKQNELTQKLTANIGVTPAKGGPIPR